MMKKAWFRRTVIIIGALMLLNMSLRTFLAINAGQPFLGQNYWGAPIGVYLMLPVLLFAIPLCLWWAIRNW